MWNSGKRFRRSSLDLRLFGRFPGFPIRDFAASASSRAPVRQIVAEIVRHAKARIRLWSSSVLFAFSCKQIGLMLAIRGLRLCELGVHSVNSVSKKP